MATQEKLYTADEFYELTHNDHTKKWELVKGKIVEVSPTGDIHTVLAAELVRLIGNFVVPDDLGDVTTEGGGYYLSFDPDTVRAPDVGYVAKERLKPKTGKYYPIPPDLAVEIMSPSDTATEIHEKVQEYLNAGTKQVWVVYPKTHSVVVHTAQHATTLDVNATLEGGAVLPGFKISLRDLFKRLREEELSGGEQNAS